MSTNQIFKPSDFYNSVSNSMVHYQLAADIANRIIESKLGPKVYTVIREGKPWTYGWAETDTPINDTHTAYLFDVQKLPEKECIEHKPKIKSGGVSLPGFDDRFGGALMLGCSIVCEVCNIELTARWEAKK